MSSSKFKKVFATLPPEAQHALVEKHLAALLDLIPKEKSKKVLASATRLQAKYNHAPKLDLRAKRKQISSLLDDLTRDAKISFIKERSNREELLTEVVHSLVSWLNDIWSVVYEYKAHFAAGHGCLLFVADALAQLSESSTLGGCKCSVMNLPIEFSLKDKTGKLVKRFSTLGPQNVDRILLWIWRDLFVSLLSVGSERERNKLPDYLEDIQTVLGVSALERLLYGGRPLEEEEEEEDDYEDIDDDDEIDFYGGVPCDEDDDSQYDSDESDDRCPCNLHANYWPNSVNRERNPLRDCVEKHLFAFFKETPSLRVYNSLRAISPHSRRIDAEVSKLLMDIASDSPDNLVAALDIFIALNDYTKLAHLLDSYMYLLRPRDRVTLQCAVALLDDSRYQPRCLAIVEKELEYSLQAVHSIVVSCFAHVEDEPNKAEIIEILKLKVGSTSRKSRIEQWADKVISSPSGPINPVAVAAMMMGFPMMPGVDGGDDTDILNYVDLDQNDPDLDDVREEYKPNLKAQFDGWVHLGQTLKGGPALLIKLYTRAIEMMPYIRGTDIVHEMVHRLNERSNKIYIGEALVNLAAFAKVQRKKLNLTRTGDKKRSSGAQSGASSSASSQRRSTMPVPPPPLSAGAPFTFGLNMYPTPGPPPPLPFPFPPTPGGMEDVD